MIHGRTCNLCEAMCGILVDVEHGAGGAVVKSIKGDPDDPLSRGHICPKATALADLYTDQDRLQRPLKKRGRDFEEISWETAVDELAERVRAVQRQHGRDAVALYQGNPTVHSVGAMTFGQLFGRALGTRTRFSATSVDQLPHMLAALQMFGNQLLLPVPDVDRAKLFVCIGGNPLASNGSIMSAPGIKQRLRAIQERGGRVVVIDPRKTETAGVADQHLFIRPGTDAALLAAIARALFDEPHLVDRVGNGGGLRGPLAGFCDGVDDVRAALAPFSIEGASAATGIAVADIQGLVRALADTSPAVVYARMGACTQEFGGTTAWLVNVVNVLTGNLDRAGGAMFSLPAADIIGLGRKLGLQGHFARRRSRVRELPEFGGEWPTAVLAEEIETPGPGQIKALITSAGNPVLSSPDGARLERALPSLSFMASIDFYVNETTRHADLILPPTSPLEREHYDLVFHGLAVRNTARWSDATIERPAHARHDWEIFLALASALSKRPLTKSRSGLGLRAALQDQVVHALFDTRGPRPIIDLLLRIGPHRTSVAALQKSKSGLDFGALRPCLPGRLQTKSQRLQLAPALYLDDLQRLARTLFSPLPVTSSSSSAASSPSSSSSSEASAASGGGLVLIGRRDLRSNNSWLHNSERLVRGKPRCTLLMHESDARTRGLHNGQPVAVTSSTGSITLPLEVTADIMPGVVSVPHGWGHQRAGTAPGVRLSVASAQPGVSINDVTDAARIDPLTGNASFSGTPVEVSAASAAAPVPETP